MRCFPRPLTCAVKLILILSAVSLAGVLDGEKARELALRKIKEEFGDRVKIKEVSLFISKPIHYRKLERVELSVREGMPRGSVHIYLLTDRGTRRVSLVLDLLWRCEVFVAAEDIGRGERIYPWQVVLKSLYMSRCPRQGIEDPEELVNYITLRSLRKEEVIKKSYLKKEPLVRRGEEVNIIFRRGNLEISFVGKALDNGFLGDTIRVRSANTGKILRGRVISEGSVLVK